jgi:hypothetical protein
MILMAVSVFTVSGTCSFEYSWLVLLEVVAVPGILFGMALMTAVGKPSAQGSLFATSAVAAITFSCAFQLDAFTAATVLLLLGKACMAAGLAVAWVHTAELFSTKVGFANIF